MSVAVINFLLIHSFFLSGLPGLVRLFCGVELSVIMVCHSADLNELL